jgi:hypothetical protein
VSDVGAKRKFTLLALNDCPNAPSADQVAYSDFHKIAAMQLLSIPRSNSARSREALLALEPEPKAQTRLGSSGRQACALRSKQVDAPAQERSSNVPR